MGNQRLKVDHNLKGKPAGANRAKKANSKAGEKHGRTWIWRGCSSAPSPSSTTTTFVHNYTHTLGQHHHKSKNLLFVLNNLKLHFV